MSLTHSQAGRLAHINDVNMSAAELERMADRLIGNARSSAGCLTRRQLQRATQRELPVGTGVIRGTRRQVG
jgi:hypothetical protein